MRWLQVVGYSGVGKTAILARLARRLQADGQTILAIKVSHHTLPAEGGDTGRLLAAGAAGAALLDEAGRWRWIGPPAWLPALLPGAPVDWVLVEGGRHWPTSKVILAAAAWPAHNGPVLGSVGPSPGLAPWHLTAALPAEAEEAAAWIYGHRTVLSVGGQQWRQEMEAWPW